MSGVLPQPVRRAVLGLSLALVALLAGCIPTTYTYPVDVFNEMHYQQSYRLQEPPRLGPPPGAVPVTGGEPVLAAAALAQARNPLPATPANLAAARVLYDRNCAFCHGPQGKADGIIVAYFKDPRYNGPVPRAYDDPAVRAKSDGELFATVTDGLRDEQTLVGMPAFRRLLSEQERWLLVHQIRAFQGQ